MWIAIECADVQSPGSFDVNRCCTINNFAFPIMWQSAHQFFPAAPGARQLVLVGSHGFDTSVLCSWHPFESMQTG
jgi:hypothetical protein